jgi:hypothetical protein
VSAGRVVPFFFLSLSEGESASPSGGGRGKAYERAGKCLETGGKGGRGRKPYKSTKDGQERAGWRAATSEPPLLRETTLARVAF